MTLPGPLLETLTRRLAECPPDFLAEPRLAEAGVVQVEAVVADLVERLGGPPLSAGERKAFQAGAAQQRRNRLRVSLVACWLLADPWFAGRRDLAQAARRWLTAGPAGLETVPVERFVTDPDRREELARTCLGELGLHPAGETESQAQDRWLSISSVERQRVITAARAAEARAQEVRAAMARQAAYDAQMKAMRE